MWCTHMSLRKCTYFIDGQGLEHASEWVVEGSTKNIELVQEEEL